jgi:hypothetical protein
MKKFSITLIFGLLFMAFRCGSDYKNNSVVIISGKITNEGNEALSNFSFYLAHDYPGELRYEYTNQKIIKTDEQGNFSFLSPEPQQNGATGTYPMLKFIDTTWHSNYFNIFQNSDTSGPLILLPTNFEFQKIDLGTIQLFQP